MSDSNITVVRDSQHVTVGKEYMFFDQLHEALSNRDWDAAEKFLSLKNFVEKWCNKITFKNNVLFLNEEMLPTELQDRIIKMSLTDDDPSYLIKFYEKLKKNPSARSVEQLWNFLNLTGIPITEDGDFLAYKGITSELLDVHTRTISNKPGAVVSLERNKVSDDPNTPCHYGLHVGSLEYASSFADTVVICKVSPENVVCVPYDHSYQKMRVCKYTVVGFHNDDGHLPSTTFSEDEEFKRLSKIDSTCEEPLDLEYEDNEGLEDEDECLEDETVTDGRNKGNDLLVEYCVFENLHTHQDFEKFSMSDLRKYASNVLKIVGASRVTGGKTKLIQLIVKTKKKLLTSKK